MFEYINYLSDKKKLIAKISSVKKNFAELNEMGIDVTDAISKLDSVIGNIESDTISIVLVGAFSDGKTSVIAGWLNEKVNNMKIDSDESSDEILRYIPATLPDGCQIVDTPGLFGDKIGNDENGSSIALSDLTKKYISEANVILYVVPAKNPIKDSHKACIRWILNDLNKLSSIVFVINRMDDVVDLTDEEEFDLQKQIKTDSLREKLLECGVNKQDAENVKVVCVSAAPGGKDIETWKEHRDEYLHRSRMNELEEITNEILKDSRETLIAKTGCDVLNDELNMVLSEINRQEQVIEKIVLPEKKESLKRNHKDLDALKRRIRQSREDIKTELKKLKKNKMTKIRSATIETFRDVLEDEIGLVKGKEGNVITEDITSIYDRYAEMYSGWTIDTGEKFQAEYDKQNTAIDNMLKNGSSGAALLLKGAGNISVNAFKQAIFAGRNVLGKIGIVIKFKPWQVTKIATFMSEALPIIGAAIDVVSNIVENVKEKERNKKFNDSKDQIRNSIEELFASTMEQLNDDNWYFDNFAPDVKILENQIKNDEKEIEEIEETRKKYLNWSKKVNSMECSII